MFELDRTFGRWIFFGSKQYVIALEITYSALRTNPTRQYPRPYQNYSSHGFYVQFSSKINGIFLTLQTIYFNSVLFHSFKSIIPLDRGIFFRISMSCVIVNGFFPQFHVEVLIIWPISLQLFWYKIITFGEQELRHLKKIISFGSAESEALLILRKKTHSIPKARTITPS